MNIWYNICGWLLSVLTALGNGFIIIFVARTRRLHSPPNWFVLSLAVADFGVGIIIFPTSYACLEPQPSISCNKKLHMAAYWFLAHSSVANLCILTWDRYQAIVHPLKYITSITATHPGRMILLAWVIPLLISLYLVLGMYASNSPTIWKVLRLTGVSGFDILCSALLVYTILRILVVARAQLLQNSKMNSVKRFLESSRLQVWESESAAENTPYSRWRHHSAGFIVAIVVFFLAGHAGINYIILHIAFGSTDVNNIAGPVVTFLLVTNSAINPMVYAFLKRDIKTELARLRCKFKR